MSLQDRVKGIPQEAMTSCVLGNFNHLIARA